MCEVEHVQQTEDQRETRSNKKGQRADRKTAQQGYDEVFGLHPLRSSDEQNAKDCQHDDSQIVFAEEYTHGSSLGGSKKMVDGVFVIHEVLHFATFHRTTLFDDDIMFSQFAGNEEILLDQNDGRLSG